MANLKRPLLALSISILATITGQAYAEEVNANTGIASGSVIGSGSMQAQDTGVAVNGSADGNLNNNQNALTNQNLIQPVIISPSTSGGGLGGSSALILPRNPLQMPNATLGRSNFGLQFGVQNNPGLTNTTSNNLGWFAQAGLTIPFGRIPKIPQSDMNADKLVEKAGARKLRLSKHEVKNGKGLQGRVIKEETPEHPPVQRNELEAVTYTPRNDYDRKMKTSASRLLAVAVSEVYSKPLFAGQKTGAVEVGEEYIYLGHTRSGWVKVLLPTGESGWTNSKFEVVKYDLAEIEAMPGDTEFVYSPAGLNKVANRQDAGL